MPEFKLTKQILFEAALIVDAKDGLEAAQRLYAWTPKQWTMREGDSSSAPYADPDLTNGWTEGQPEYEVRSCRGHFHVMHCGEDICIAGDPFSTREDAEAAMLREQAGKT